MDDLNRQISVMVVISKMQPANFRKQLNFLTGLTLKVLHFCNFTSHCNLKPLWSGMGEVVPAHKSPTLHPPSPPTVHQLLRLAL